MSSANILNGIILLVKPHFSSPALAAFHFPVVPYIWIWWEKAKKFCGKRRFPAGAAVLTPFLPYCISLIKCHANHRALFSWVTLTFSFGFKECHFRLPPLLRQKIHVFLYVTKISCKSNTVLYIDLHQFSNILYTTS